MITAEPNETPSQQLATSHLPGESTQGDGRFFKTTIQAGYKKLNLLYVRDPLSENLLCPGLVTALIANIPDFAAEGTLNPRGGLSGMSRVYATLKLEIGDEIFYTVASDSQIVIHSIKRKVAAESAPPSAASREAITPEPVRESVFQKKRLRHIHIEVFSPENLRRWEPENEPDVYMVFGILQEYTKYRYCCATSKALLGKLAYCSDTKPDAILIDDDTGG